MSFAMATNAKKNAIISVGFSVELPSDINDVIWQQIGKSVYKQAEYPEIPLTVTAGVLYGKLCKGGLQDVHSTQEQMDLWYLQRTKHKVSVAYIRRIYIFQKPNIIVTEITVANDRAFVFLSKNDGMSTTLYKKCINKNEYNGEPIHCIVLKEPIKVNVSVYKHLAQ